MNNQTSNQMKPVETKEKQVCSCCGKPRMLFIVQKPSFRVTSGCKDCDIYQNEQGAFKHYVGEVIHL